MKTCPRCKGEKNVRLFVCASVCEWRTMPCFTCKGAGEITDEHDEALAKGEAMRLDRISRGLSSREEAKRLGITDIELNRREFAKEFPR